MAMHHSMEPSRVTTHSGYKVDEYPLTFTAPEGHALTVMEIEDRWYDPRGAYFRVFADDAGRYLLRRDNASGQWAVRAV